MMIYQLLSGLKREILFFFFLFLFHLSVFSQNKPGINNENTFLLYADSLHQSYTKDRPYYLLSWNDKIPSSITAIRRINEKTAVIKILTYNEYESLNREFYITPANNQWKYSPSLQQSIASKKTDFLESYVITCQDIEQLQSFLKVMSNDVTITGINKPSNSLVIKCTASFISNTIAVLKDVIFIDQYAQPHTEIGIIGYSRDFHGINQVDYSITGANGKNIVVGVKEQKMEDNDLDLYKRVVPSSLSSANVTNHATVISSIIGGAGNSFYNGRGIANACNFFSSSFTNLFADDASILNTNKVTVQNHSYGTIVQQFYGAEAVSYDFHSWQNKNFIHILSSGNSGKLAATEGKYAGIVNYANLTGNFKMAKNIITVGAIDNAGNIPAESSSGPAYDGRLVPQLIALGPNGTSDAAAIVSGTVAVMQQVFADSNSQVIPPASLIKAILFNTAHDIYKTGIDYKTGYGLINSYAAIKSAQQKNYAGSSLSQNQSWTKNITVPANTAQLKITLAWTDTVATVNNNKALLNDLDIELIELATGNIFKPWVLSTAANIDSLEKLPVRKRDSLNTAEQISILLPNAGNYLIKVTGSNIINSQLPFHIAYNIDTLNTFTFISPQHTSDVNRAENETLTIKWKTFVADSNETGNLFISYDNGTNWQLLKQSHKIYSNQFQWQIKDTSSTALLKMTTSFGTFFSNNFIISKVIRTTVDFICNDSFRLSWDKHVYATGYKIFALTDSAFLKPILVVTDTFKVFKRMDYPYVVYAVEPVLSNNIPAARSIASNIELQGVYCFYRTFYYNQLDQNDINLILELSIASYTDSVFFERVSSQGQLLQTYGAVKVTNNNLLLSQFVNKLSGGITYFRSKIKLKNGAVVFTDIISILTSGKENIIFYPNPAGKNGPLNYVLKQGIPADSRLQLFDISGKLLKNFSSLPTSINITNLPTGIIIYKLLGNDNSLLATGKLVIVK